VSALVDCGVDADFGHCSGQLVRGTLTVPRGDQGATAPRRGRQPIAWLLRWQLRRPRR
jgi:hypothetical protein